MTHCLVLDAISAGYREPVVRDVSFTVDAGEIVAVVGVNGAGKSTLLKAVAGEARIHGGRCRLGSVDVTGFRGDALSRLGLGYVPQLDAVFPGLSVLDNLRAGGYLVSRRELGKRCEEVLARFPQLGPKRSALARRLSGGETKQLAIGRALMSAPKVLLLDEPTASLSPRLAGDILASLLPDLASGGTAIVLVEQRIEPALHASNRACVIGAGRMQLLATAAEALEHIRTVGLFDVSEVDARQAASTSPTSTSSLTS